MLFYLKMTLNIFHKEIFHGLGDGGTIGGIGFEIRPHKGDRDFEKRPSAKM